MEEVEEISNVDYPMLLQDQIFVIKEEESRDYLPLIYSYLEI
jgi:hypothetical protein